MRISIIEKVIVTFLILLTIFGGIMVQETSEIVYPSQSFAADKDNKIWYILMHIGLSMTFYFLGAIFNNKKFMYTITAFAGLGVLGFNMFEYGNIPHQIFTAALFILASYSIIKYAPNKNIKFANAIICSIYAIFFLLAVINPILIFTVYQIEMIIEIGLGSIIIIDLIRTKYRQKIQVI